MEKDKHLQQILFNSAEGASAGFTDAVMKSVNSLAEARLHYQPLVNLRWERLFLFVFGGLVMAILTLCAGMALAHTQMASWLADINLPEVNYKKALIFIFTFWLVFLINALLEKKLWPRRVTINNRHH